jgi:hypothetical protein
MRPNAILTILASMLAVSACAELPAGMKPWYALSDESFSPIKAGAAKSEVEKLVGTPPLVSKYAGPQQEVWTYKHLAGARMYVTDVVFGPDGRVQQMAQYPDPAYTNNVDSH